MRKAMMALLAKMIGFVVYCGKSGNVCFDGVSIFQVNGDGSEGPIDSKTFLRARMAVEKAERKGTASYVQHKYLKLLREEEEAVDKLFERAASRQAHAGELRKLLKAQKSAEAQLRTEWEGLEKAALELDEGSEEQEEAMASAEAGIDKYRSARRKLLAPIRAERKWLAHEGASRVKAVKVLEHAIQQSEAKKKNKAA